MYWKVNGMSKMDDYDIVRKWDNQQLFNGIILTSRPDVQTMFLEFISRNITNKKMNKLVDECL